MAPESVSSRGFPPWRRLYKRKDVALDYAPPVLEFAKTALALAPVPGLPLIAELLSAIVERLKNARTNRETKAALFKKIAELHTAITGLVNRARSSAASARTADLQERLKALTDALAGVKNTADSLRRGRGVGGFFKGFFYAKYNEAILAEMNKELETALATFNFQAHVAVELAVHGVAEEIHDVGETVHGAANAVHDMGDDVRGVREAVDDAHKAVLVIAVAVDGMVEAVDKVDNRGISAEERTILESIPYCDSAGYRCVDETKSGFMEGTRVELFEELQKWCTTGFPADSPKALYHLSGSAGLGKSAVAHQLCTRIENEWRLNLGGSFFFVCGSGDCESARSLFPTLAYQLAHLQPCLRPRIVKAAEEYVKHGAKQQVKISFEQLLLEPLNDAPESLADHPVTFLVIDGLDECKDRELVPELLRCLLELVRRVPWLRLFIASRPEPHILPILVSSDNRDVVYHRSLNDTKEDWKDDVALFLRDTVPKIGRHGDYVRANPKVLDRLITRAEGVFVFAGVAVRFLEQYDDDPGEQFRCLFATTGTGVAALDGLYLHILRRAFPSEDMASDRARHDRLKGVLSFIVLRKYPLSVGAMAVLLDITDTQALWISDRLRSVVHINDVGNVVPVHATFGEFLIDKRRCTDALYHVDSAKGHALLASRCLAAYSFNTITHFLRCNCQGTDHSFTWYIEYACMCWDDHLAWAERSAALDLLLYKVVRMWLPILTRIFNDGLGTKPEGLKMYLEGTDEALCNEYCHFFYQYTQWWTHIVEADSEDTRRYVLSHVESLKLDWRKYGEEKRIQYQTALDNLVEKIRLSSTEGLWYNNDCRWW